MLLIRYNCKLKRARYSKNTLRANSTIYEEAENFSIFNTINFYQVTCAVFARSQRTLYDIEIYRTSFLLPSFAPFLFLFSLVQSFMRFSSTEIVQHSGSEYRASLKESYREANATTRHTVRMTSNMTHVRLIELVRERDIELRSHTWKQTDDASDRPGKFRSLCIYST